MIGNTEQNKLVEHIVLPVNAGVREAYIAILKTAYLEEKDIFYFHEFVQMVQADCGVSQETAENRCKQLRTLGLLVYLNSGMGGHSYCFCMYRKNTIGVFYIDNWQEAKPLIETQFKDDIESEFFEIRRSMNILGKPSGMRRHSEMKVNDLELNEKVESELKRLESAKTIHAGEDIIKSGFETTRKTSNEEICKEFEDRLNTLRVSSGNEGSTLEQENLGENNTG